MSSCRVTHNALLKRLDGDPRTWGRQARVAVLGQVEGLRGWLDAKPQRSAARAVHNTCCVAGCDLAFEYCQLHHIHWWLHGGPTNLDNLVPVCNKHHRLIHDHKWDLTVDTNRVGTLHSAHQQHRTPMLC